MLDSAEPARAVTTNVAGVRCTCYLVSIMLASWNIDFVAYVRCRKLWSTACACSAREVCELQKQINRFFMDKSITTIVSGGASHLAGSRGVPCTQRACCAVLCCTLIAAPGLTSVTRCAYVRIGTHCRGHNTQKSQSCMCARRSVARRPQGASVATASNDHALCNVHAFGRSNSATGMFCYYVWYHELAADEASRRKSTDKCTACAGNHAQHSRTPVTLCLNACT